MPVFVTLAEDKFMAGAFCRVCRPCPSDATDESEDPEAEVHDSEVHECEVHESEVHESMAQDQHKM